MSIHKFILLALTLTVYSGVSLAEQSEKRVLFLSSYHPSFPTFFRQLNGIRGELSESEYIVDVEYLDSKRFTSLDHQENIRRSLEYKISRLSPYDGVIGGDDNALKFLLAEQQNLFAGVPIVFFGINDRKLALSNDSNPFTTGFVEATSVEETIETALVLLPQTTVIYVIVDGTPTARAELEIFREVRGSFPGIRFEELSLTTMSFAELTDQLKQIESNAQVLLLGAYHDKDGRILSFEEVLPLIYSSSGKPILYLWRHSMGLGILGGKLIDHQQHAAAAAATLGKIISGEKRIEEIPVETESPNSYFFDFNELRRFHIPLSRLPQGSIILNRPASLVRDNPGVVILIFIIVLVQTAIILVLAHTTLSRRRDKKILEQAERRFRDIFEYSPTSLWEEDFSQVRKYLEELVVAGVSDIPAHIQANPDLGSRFAEMVMVRDANKSALLMNGLEDRNRIIGELSRTLKKAEHGELLKEISAMWRGALEERWEIHFTRDDGTEVWGEVSLAIAPGSEESWEEVYVAIQDVTIRKEAEVRISAALEEKKVLLKEIHHRVKNNLAIITAFLHLTSQRSINQETTLLLKDCEARIHSMARVHEGLYLSDDLRFIDLPRYLEDNTRYLVDMYQKRTGEIELKNSCEDLHLTIDTLMPLGLIVTEAVTNAIKHGTHNVGNPLIEIILYSENQRCKLIIRDNGPGFDSTTQPTNPESIGLMLISSLAEQLNGETEIHSDSTGTAVHVSFPFST